MSGWRWAGAGVLAFGVGLSAGLAVYVHRSLPVTQGEMRLPGLKAGVLVHRDEADVTHIRADHALDAWRAMGMVHAQERGWQLEFNRRVMRGELSAVLGPATLETDKLMRTLGIRRAAERQWARLEPATQAALQAYSEGINAFLAQGRQSLTPEFHLLGIDPRPAAREGRYWDAVDSVGWLIMMALDLGGNWGNEFARLTALQTLDTEGLWTLFPPYPGEARAARADLAALYREWGVFRQGASPSAGAGATEGGLVGPIAQALAEWTRELGNLEGKGSNNWLVDGTRSASGKPLLANDPHLGLSAPAIWYFARLQAPAEGNDPALDVIGATLPGLPFVVLGRTAGAAWGFTNTGPDVQDLYLEQINPDNPAQYRVPGPAGAPAWANFEQRQERIQVKGQDDVLHTVRSTRHGPVLSDAQARHAEVIDTSRFVLSLRWTALDDDNATAEAGFRVNRAQTVDELSRHYERFHAPMQNVLMADTAGRVAYKAAGRVPLRHPDNDIMGVAPSPGWDARYDWQGWLPFEQTPQDDGARGWIATANQRIHGPDYPHFITSDWAPPYRQARIEALLAQTPRHDPTSFAAMHADDLSLATAKLLPLLQATPVTHPLGQAAQAALQGFDGRMRADLAAPLIYTAWVDELTRAVIGGRLGQARFEALYGKRLFRDAMEMIVARDDRAWCGEAGCVAASQAALTRALTRLQQDHGADVAAWRWGDAHPALSVHRPLSSVKPLARWFEVRVPSAGDPFTINVGQYHLDKTDAPFANRHAASLRAIYDLADPENSRFIYQTGQSGNVFDRRYRDMRHAWAQVSYRPLRLTPGFWRSTLALKPDEGATRP